MRPAVVDEIWNKTRELGFPMASEPATGTLLQTLVATKPGGRILELGTGTGLGTAWILAGMDSEASLNTVDNDPAYLAVCHNYLGDDPRLTIHEGDGAAFIMSLAGQTFDFIFADTWPGKFSQLDETLALVAPGGIYFIDDLLPQASWPADHAPKVPRLIRQLKERSDFAITQIDYATGVLIATKLAGE